MAKIEFSDGLNNLNEIVHYIHFFIVRKVKNLFQIIKVKLTRFSNPMMTKSPGVKALV